MLIQACALVSPAYEAFQRDGLFAVHQVHRPALAASGIGIAQHMEAVEVQQVFDGLQQPGIDCFMASSAKQHAAALTGVALVGLAIGKQGTAGKGELSISACRAERTTNTRSAGIQAMPNRTRACRP